MIRFLIIGFAFTLMLASCGENKPVNASSPTLTEMTLTEMILGQENAPITIVEYASMTCGHCAQFHLFTLPKLKRDFIDTGKVRLIFREFPLDPWATSASLVARCVSGKNSKRFFAFIGILFKKQAQWINSEDRLAELQKISRQAGLSGARFRQCFDNQKLLEGLNHNKQRGENDNVRATPSFLINNNALVEGNQPYNKLREIIESELP